MENDSFDVEVFPLKLETLSNLLDYVVLNRNKRKVKQIMKTGIEFLFTVGPLILSVLEMEGEISTLSFVVMVNVIGLIIFVTAHAHNLPPKTPTYPEIEEAYKLTNSKPFVDGLLEIPLARRFGGVVMVYSLWSVFFLTMVSLLVTLITTFSAPYLFSSLLASLTLYDLTSDLCEYWVYTRPHDDLEEAKEEAKQTEPK